MECLLIHYAIDNKGGAEDAYRKERVEYEKTILLGQLIEGLGKSQYRANTL